MVKRRFNLSELSRHRVDNNELEDCTEPSAASPSFYTELSLDPSARGSKGGDEYESVKTVLSAPTQYETMSTPDTADSEHVYSKVDNI